MGLLAHAAGCAMVVGARQGSLFWGSPGKAVLRFIQLKLSAFVAGEPIPDTNSAARRITFWWNSLANSGNYPS